MAVRASRAFSTSESASRTTPSPRNTHWAGTGKKNPSAAAISRHTTAPVSAWRLSRLVTLSPPPLRLEGPEGEEQREHDSGQVVDEILGVDQPAREAIEVIGERQVLAHPAQAAPRELGPPSHDPEGEQDPEGAEAGHDLVLGQGRHEHPHRQERGAGQDQAEVTGEDRAPLDAGEVGDEPRIEQGQGEQDRVGQQQLEGPRLPLLREQAHREHRDEEQQHHAHVAEERTHHVLDHVEVLAELRLHERAHRRVAVEREDRAEEDAGDEQEEREDHVGHRGAEVELHLLLEDRQPAHQRASSSAATTSGATCSPATTRMTTSSRLMPTWCSSWRAQFLPVTRRTRSARTSRSRSDSTTKPTPPSREARGSTATTPGTARRAPATSPDAFATRTSMRAVGNTCCTSSDSVPWATMRPWLMMTMPSHTIDTSGRMCVERITVCWPASERISARISAICRGSSPMVGSSRISTSGSPSRAWASPTRCR